MEKLATLIRPAETRQPRESSDTLQGEMIRKSLHLLIALVPLMASYNLEATVALLACGTLFYAFAEKLRIAGRTIFIVSDLTIIASRERDRGRFVLGPVTLGVGALLALLLYPSTAAALAIYALAFGDGLASLAGKLLHSPRIPLTCGKTLAGSLACFGVVLLSTLRLTGSPLNALILAAAATGLEMIPLRDFDNLILPVGVGFVASRFLVL